MATISRIKVAHGYCEVDKGDIGIEIEYISIRRPTDANGERTFTKNRNMCYYLNEGKCSKHEDCEIHKNAQLHYTEYVGRV